MMKRLLIFLLVFGAYSSLFCQTIWLKGDTLLNALQGVTFANGKFVAVGGGIYSSPDGIAWTPSSTQGFFGIAHDSLFVAVGFKGAIATSADGIIWTSRSAGVTLTRLNHIAYGNNSFVAVGDSGYTTGMILTSTNGVTWISRSIGNEPSLCGVTYGGNQFVAVGTNGTVLTSTNGITWIQQSSGTSQTLMDITYGNNLFVAVGAAYPSSSTIFTSPDGVTWSKPISVAGVNFLGVTWGGSMFLAVGTSGTILTSPDGIIWTSQNSGTTWSLWDICFGNGKYVAVGYGSGAAYGVVLTSAVPPSAPTLALPANAATNISVSPNLSWNASVGADSYTLQVSASSSFSSFVVDTSGLTALSYLVSGLSNNMPYFWRVKATNLGGTSAWSSVWSFTTVPPTAVVPSSFSISLSGAILANRSIRYSIPKQCHVFIASYDIRGQLIHKFVSIQQSPGYYSVNLQNIHLATGRYFIRFIAGDFRRAMSFFVK